MSVGLLGFITLLPTFLDRLLHAAACCTSSLLLLVILLLLLPLLLFAKQYSSSAACKASILVGTQAVRLQVDATIAKSVQRVTGSVIGAVYAFLVMLRPVVATNPYAVATMVCFSAFMCGLLVEHRFRYGSFLALYTSAVVMLAQVWVRQQGLWSATAPATA